VATAASRRQPACLTDAACPAMMLPTSSATVATHTCRDNEAAAHPRRGSRSGGTHRRSWLEAAAACAQEPTRGENGADRRTVCGNRWFSAAPSTTGASTTCGWVRCAVRGIRRRIMAAAHGAKQQDTQRQHLEAPASHWPIELGHPASAPGGASLALANRVERICSPTAQGLIF